MSPPKGPRRASLPPADYQPPSNLSTDGLQVSVVSEDGIHLGIIDFQDAAGPEPLRRELVAAFARLCSAAGSWRRWRTCEKNAVAVGKFLAFASRKAPMLCQVAELTPGIWAEWKLTGDTYGAAGIAAVRKVLDKVGTLPEATRTAMHVRGHQRKPERKVAAYTTEEFKHIRAVARRQVNQIEQRISHGRSLLRRYQDGELAAGSDEGRIAALLAELSRTGDVARYQDGQLHTRVREVCALVPGGYRGLNKLLFPSAGELGALATLLICEEGWNLSVLEELDVPDFRPDGGLGDVAIYRTGTVKHRRPVGLRHASHNLVDLGPGSPGRAMRQVLAITEEARQCLARQRRPTRRLLVGRRVHRNGSDYSTWTIGAVEHCIHQWGKTLDLTSPSGGALHVTAQRLRRTHQALFGGPRQNTLQTHEYVYLLRNEQVLAESAEVIAQGLQDAADHATAQVRMRLLRASPNPDQAEIAALADQAGVPVQRMRELLAGQQDTVAGACVDFEHSPFTPSGPCSASFLLCFACGNALAMPRHLPRIIYLHEALTTLRSVVSQAAWAADWAAHHARVSDLLAVHTTEAERRALRAELSDRDRALIDQMLQRRLDA